MTRSIPGPSHPLDLARVRAEPLNLLTQLASTYGDIVRYEVDGRTGVLLNRPDYIRHVLQDNNHIYSKLGTPDLMMLRPLLGEGLMTTEGEVWSRQRRLAQPMFTGSPIRRMAEWMAETTQERLARWSEPARGGQCLDIDEEMSGLTLAIVARCLFGMDLQQDMHRFGEAVGVMNDFMAHFQPGEEERLKRFQTAMVTMNQIVLRIILARKFQPEPESAEDLLALLMRARGETHDDPLSDRELRDQIFTFLMAGHETTAKSLTWTLYMLDQHPSVQELVRAEVDTVLGDGPLIAERVEQLRVLKMVLQETQRLYPPVWLMSRRCCRTDELDGYEIPEGTLVSISPYLMHRHPGWWEAPLEFQPERFAPEQRSERPAFTWFPFSGGPRTCIGSRFANTEAPIVLASILRRYTLRREPSHPVEPEALVTLRPRHGLRMYVEHRRAP